MSSAAKIILYLLGTLALGAALAPPLFWAGNALGGSIPSLRWLRDTDFHSYFDRAMFLAALLLLWPTARALRIGGWRDLGLERDPRAGWHLAGGFLLAGGLLWALGGWLWSRGIYIPNPKGKPSGGTLGGFLLTAAVVAALEEGFFRGGLLGLVRRTASGMAALIFVSALFAVVHFLKPPEDEAGNAAVGWASGFAFLPQVFWQWHEPRLVLGGLLTLFTAALVLGWARLRTRALWLPVGLHAGWVFGLKSFARSSKHIAPPDVWFGENLLTGLGPALTLAATGAVVWIWLQTEKESGVERQERRPGRGGIGK